MKTKYFGIHYLMMLSQSKKVTRLNEKVNMGWQLAINHNKPAINAIYVVIFNIDTKLTKAFYKDLVSW